MGVLRFSGQVGTLGGNLWWIGFGMLMLCAFVCAVSARLRCEFWILSFLELLLLMCCLVWWFELCLWQLLFGEFLTLWKLYSVRWTWERKKKNKKKWWGRGEVWILPFSACSAVPGGGLSGRTATAAG